jgi:hypothetical protein
MVQSGLIDREGRLTKSFGGDASPEGKSKLGKAR